MKTGCAVETVEERIRRRIEEQGAIAFSEFMEMALYHPELGYYSKNEASEDYYTNVDVHPIYSELLAQFFYKEWKAKFKNDKDFYIVELGCGSGKLAEKILSWLARNASECFGNLNYFGVEKSSARVRSCERLKSIFPDRAAFKTEFDFSENSITGIVFSNEFFDALPFHRVFNSNGRLQEIFIQQNFREILAEPTTAVQEYFDWLGVGPAEHCAGEVQLESRNYIRKIARALRKGTILTIDYGFEAAELYSETRPEGTAICHFRHRTNRSFYEHVGSQDITAHVNFTALIKEAKIWGVESLPLKTQSQFLLQNGMDEMLKAMQSSQDPRKRLKTSSAIKSLVHPEGMGGTFKALLQRK